MTKFKDIQTKIVPLFQIYLLQGDKLLNFQDFCKASEIFSCGGHLTVDGILKLDELRSQINRNRKNVTEDGLIGEDNVT